MGFLDGIGGAISGAWNATIGQAVKAVTNLFSPPPAPPAPTMAKDSASLSVGATNWEKSANIIAGNTGRIVSNGGASLADFSGVITNGGGNFNLSVVKDGERNHSGNNPSGGVYDTQLGNHDIVVMGDGVKVGVDGGVVITKGDRTIVAEGSKTGPNGETIPVGKTTDITDILKGKGQIISNNGATVITNGGGNILSGNTANILSGNTANIIGGNTGNIIGGNTANIIGDKGGS